MEGSLVGGSRLVMAGLLAGTRCCNPQDKKTITKTMTKPRLLVKNDPYLACSW